MASSQQMRRSVLALVLVAVLALMFATTASAEDNGLRQEGQGKYAHLTAEWWQWILEQPWTSNPNLDTTGDYAANGQPGKGVFFVAGAFGGPVTRSFTVPADTALFVPVLNNLGLAPHPAPQPKPDENQIPQLRTLYAAPFVDDATGLYISLDGQSLMNSVVRVMSPVFHVVVPEDGLLDPGRYSAVSDGYWLYMPPLSPGVHVLSFGGASGGFTVDITDIITVE